MYIKQNMSWKAMFCLQSKHIQLQHFLTEPVIVNGKA